MKRKSKWQPLITALSLLMVWFGSCSLINLKQDIFFTAAPVEDYEIMDKDVSISIQFSEAADRKSVESIVSVRRNNSSIDLHYDWESDTRLILSPLEDLYRGVEYRLHFKGMYRNSAGTEREATLSRPFYVESSDFSPLRVTESFPHLGGRLNVKDTLVIHFNQPFDPASLDDALKLSPSEEFDLNCSGDNRILEIIPEEGWANLQNYRLRIDGTLNSMNGDPLLPEWELPFFVENSVSIPEVRACGSCSRNRMEDFPWVSDNLDTLLESQGIRIRFSEAMDRDSCEGAFSIEPPLAGDFFWTEGDLVFLPDSGFQSGQSFRLQISTRAESTGGIAMETPYVRDFSPFIEAVELITLECSSAEGFELSTFSTTEAVDLPVEAPYPSELLFHFTFSVPFSADSEKQAVQDALSFYEVFGSGSSPAAGMYSWSSDFRMTVLFSGFAPEPEREQYFLMTLAGGPGGISNSKGSVMKQTVSQLFRMVEQ
ncbi:MAG: hypothetical protein PQJ58_20250 [Spirochaetales bacterium]|nr:hypothetical protein [Spirochaetales bacterium]